MHKSINNMLNMSTNYGRSMCKQATWNKGKIIPRKDPNVWRMDKGGNVIRFSHHGKHKSKYGWDIDHIISKADGGADIIENLQPLRYDVNRSCGKKTSKTGMNMKKLHDARKEKQLERNPNTFLNNQELTITENSVMFVKQSPLTVSSLAKIIKIKKHTITVHWLHANYLEEIINDSDLFAELPIVRNRNHNIKSKNII